MKLLWPLLPLVAVVLLVLHPPHAAANADADGQAPSLLVVQESALSTAVMAEACAAARFASQCLSLPGCHWCCEGEAESPCFYAGGNSSTSLTRTKCTAHATLDSVGQTCAALCRAGEEDSCESCETKNWCVFCRSSLTCMAPTNFCLRNNVVQQCTAPEREPNPELAFWRTTAAVAGSAVVGAVVLLIGALLFIWLRNRMRMRQLREARDRRREMRQQQRLRDQQVLQQLRQQQQQQQQQPQPQPAAQPHTQEPQSQAVLPEEDGADDDERRPLLQATEREAAPAAPPETRMSSHPSTVLDDESLCYLCLDARPSVAFLPCYHACCCEACSNRLRPRAAEIDCPFCRRKIEAMVSLSNILNIAERSERA